MQDLHVTNNIRKSGVQDVSVVMLYISGNIEVTFKITFELTLTDTLTNLRLYRRQQSSSFAFSSEYILPSTQLTQLQKVELSQLVAWDANTTKSEVQTKLDIFSTDGERCTWLRGFRETGASIHVGKGKMKNSNQPSGCGSAWITRCYPLPKTRGRELQFTGDARRE